ncbi:MAG TPA: ABC transporter permease [Solirubrobacteraceae bacterium]|nr:ABC transporter permease [Solirubrobacteraceae bacterium]
MSVSPETPAGEAPTAAPSSRAHLRHRFPLTFYIVRRVLAGVVTVLIASAVIFAAITLLPGNVVQIILGRNANPQSVSAIENQLNQGHPAWDRYVHFMGNLFSGHLGYSTAGLVEGQKTSVESIIGPAFAHSAVLAVATLVLFIPMVIVLGLAAGLKAGSVRDTTISVTSLAISSLPEFLVGTLLIVLFFDRLRLLPPVSSVPPGTSPLSNVNILVLPVLTLLLVSLAFGSRVLRACVAEIVSQDYVVLAGIHGYSQRRIVFRYVLPNALPPTVQLIAQQLQYLIGGLVVVESVFAYPGIGTALVNAISVHDVQVVMVVSILLAAFYVMINVVADVVAILLDPRVRTTIS